MPFRVPNQVDVPSFDQAEPDAGDFVALGDRTTGVLAGGVVSAQGSPGLAVDYSGPLTYVIGGAPFVKSAGGTVAIVGGEANPRFDLVVADTHNNVVVLRGVASANPSYPALDTTSYCFLAAVYVRPSTSSIISTDIVDKRVSMPASFVRAYTSSAATAILLADAVPNVTTMLSDGSLSWGSSVLKRTTGLLNTAMDFTTTLTMRAADAVLQQLLILKGRTTNPATQNVIEVQPAASTTVLAKVTGTGVATFDNFKNGAGLPEGSVVGNPGDLYVQSTPPTLWLKITGAGNTGWMSMQTTSAANLSVMPTGSVIAMDVSPGSAVAGYFYADGSLHSATDPVYAVLYSVIQVRHGGTVGVNFNLPDYRGASLIGVEGPFGLGLGVRAGQPLGNTALTVDELAAHSHWVDDPGHTHPMPGLPYLWKPPTEKTGLRPFPWQYAPANVPGMPFMDIWPLYSDIEAHTGITIRDTGINDSFSIMGPVVGVSYYIKA